MNIFKNFFNKKEETSSNLVEEKQTDPQCLEHLDANLTSLEQKLTRQISGLQGILVEFIEQRHSEKLVKTIQDMHIDLSNLINPKRNFGSTHLPIVSKKSLSINNTMKQEYYTKGTILENVIYALEYFDGRSTNQILLEHLTSYGFLPLHTPKERAIRLSAALSQLKKTGKIKHIGVGSWELVY